MTASVTGDSLLAHADSGRGLATRLGTRIRRGVARYLAWRRFHGTRKALLRLDQRTLSDIVGLNHGEIQAMTGSLSDRRRLGLR